MISRAMSFFSQRLGPALLWSSAGSAPSSSGRAERRRAYREEEASTQFVHITAYHLINLLSNDNAIGLGLAFFLCRAQKGRLFRDEARFLKIEQNSIRIGLVADAWSI
jgi:hypothetical protein